MSYPLAPRDERDICEIVARGGRFEITGSGAKRGIGRPGRETTRITTTKLNRVIDYDPAELVLTVEPGALLTYVQCMLHAQNQMLAFEPFDFSEVSGAGVSTMGGVVGAGFSGSRRLSAGGVRDHILGFSAVNGRGEAFKAGGKVVKNVTGYDLAKLMAGSWGQLCMLTEITFKVVPRPAETRTLAVRGLSPVQAVDIMAQAMRSQAEIAAASYADGVTALRLEGFGPSVEARAQLLTRLLSGHRIDQLSPEAADAHWTNVQVARALGNLSEKLPTLWRIVVPPAQGAVVFTAIEALGGACVMDWAGGLIWAQVPLSATPAAIRALAEKSGGHALLTDASDDLRRETPALHPEPAPIAALSRRLREAFDPAGVFDPERFT